MSDVSEMPEQWRKTYEDLCEWSKWPWMPTKFVPSCKDGQWRIDCYQTDGTWDFAITDMVADPQLAGYGPVWCEFRIPDAPTHKEEQ